MKRFILLFIMAAVASMATSSLMADTIAESEAPVKDIRAPQYTTVYIHTKALNSSDRKPDVMRRWEELKYGSNEQIEWIIVPSDIKFKIKFDKKEGTPFEKAYFDNEHNISGSPIVDPGVEDQFYRYSVEVEGHTKIDPGVIIWK